MSEHSPDPACSICRRARCPLHDGEAIAAQLEEQARALRALGEDAGSELSHAYADRDEWIAGTRAALAALALGDADEATRLLTALLERQDP